jgi:hypothetical protein
MAALHAGIPIQTSINTINSQCSSGLSAINEIANLTYSRRNSRHFGIDGSLIQMTAMSMESHLQRGRGFFPRMWICITPHM